MAKVTLNPIFDGISNSIDDLVFYRKGNDTFVRRKAGPSGSPSPAQRAAREAFRGTVSVWKCLAGIAQASWNAHGGRNGMIGYTAFMGANVSRQRDCRPLEISMPLGEKAVPGITATSGGAGEIRCALTVPAGAECRQVAIFVQLLEPGGGRDMMARHDAGEAASYTVTGLRPGERYAVSAVLTDRAYIDATRISASASAECVAG